VGNLVTTPENRGTYDFEPPKGPFDAFNLYDQSKIDVDPWIVWGNSPLDKSTSMDRICAMAQSKEGEFGLNILKHDFTRCDVFYSQYILCKRLDISFEKCKNEYVREQVCGLKNSGEKTDYMIILRFRTEEYKNCQKK